MYGYSSSLEHLVAELQKVDLKLRLQIMRRRQRIGQQIDDQFRGLYISEEEIDELLASQLANVADCDEINLSDSNVAHYLSELDADIRERKRLSQENGIDLRLCYLAKQFDLSEFEIDVLLICLLPEIDLKYERLFAYLHDDVTRKRPSVDLVLQCLLDSLDQRLAQRESFVNPGALIFHRLIEMDSDAQSTAATLIARTLKIDDRIARYLLGSDSIDNRLGRNAWLVDPAFNLNNLVLPEELEYQMQLFAERCRLGIADVLYFQGEQGGGKKTVIEALCKWASVPLVVADADWFASGEMSAELGRRLVFREARLQKAALCLIGFDQLLGDDRVIKSYLQMILDEVGRFPGTVFLTGESCWEPGSVFGERVFARIELQQPSHKQRMQLWNIYMNGHGPRASHDDVAKVAEIFKFSPGQIKDAVATARNMAIYNVDSEISSHDLYASCRVMSNQKLNTLAHKVLPKYQWDDIVLPKDQKDQLREIADHVRYRHIVFSDWNFEQKVSLGKGLNVLFAGSSGTGKTMAAEIVANELGLDLYKIDLSTVISKYIGETEKNLDKIFSEAQNSNSILFFDEADAVFGKRSEIKDSHDRYANIEVAYLLQKMEEYDGIVVLATNLRKNLDEAFARRMHFSLEFPQPEERDRYQIWKRVFPPEAPVSKDMDFRFMAKQFKITGGNIKNIALGSAFFAARDGGSITIEHLVKATKREYQKIGRLCTEADFGSYFDLVKG